jgi:hypothetical protein
LGAHDLVIGVDVEGEFYAVEAEGRQRVLRELLRRRSSYRSARD